MRNTAVVFLLLRDRFDDLADFCTQKRLTCSIQFFLAELPEKQYLGAELFDHFLLLATEVDGVFLPDFIFSDREAFASEDELAFPRTALRSPSVPLW